MKKGGTMDAKVTIGMDSRGVFGIEIKDVKSGLIIVKVAMSPHDFAMALSGLALQPAIIDRPPTKQMTERFGKKRETMTVFVDRVPISIDRQDQQRAVVKHLRESGLDQKGWEIFSDGTRSQQNGSKHHATLVRWV